MAKAPFQGVYEGMEFPEYRYEEYPKWVQTRRVDSDGRPIKVMVGSKAEELKIIDEIVPIEELDGVQKERDTLASALAKSQEAEAQAAEKLAKLEAEIAKLKAPAPKPGATAGLKL